MPTEDETEAATPASLKESAFNPNVNLPYGLKPKHVSQAMQDFNEFLGLINGTLVKNGLPRLENVAMPANFSTLVSEFMHAQMPKYCSGLAQNGYHNGHPDMVPSDVYEDDSVQYGDDGIEVKASRYDSGWQGHNVEQCWLMVFYYDSNSPNDRKPVRPFKLKGVYIGELEEGDWSYSGRSDDSRRTITASVLASGRDKMKENYLYDINRDNDQSQMDIFD